MKKNFKLDKKKAQFLVVGVMSLLLVILAAVLLPLLNSEKNEATTPPATNAPPATRPPATATPTPTVTPFAEPVTVAPPIETEDPATEPVTEPPTEPVTEAPTTNPPPVTPNVPPPTAPPATKPPEPVPTALQSFAFLRANNPSLTEDVFFEIRDGYVTGKIPTGVYRVPMIATFEHDAQSLVLPEHRDNDYFQYYGRVAISGQTAFEYRGEDRLRLLYPDGRYLDYNLEFYCDLEELPGFRRIEARKSDNAALLCDAAVSVIPDIKKSEMYLLPTGEQVLFLPGVQPDANVTVRFTPKPGQTFSIDGIAWTWEYAVLREGYTYNIAVTSRTGHTAEYRLRLRAVNSNLPVISITTENASTLTDRVNSTKGSMTIYNESGRAVNTQNNVMFHMRGNSTASRLKKSITVTLYERQSLFGWAESRDWVLLADWNDKTMMRSAIGFKLATYMDNLLWTPGAEYCEVYVNGDYAGLYIFTEKPRVEKGRLDLKLMKDDNLQGDFMVEVDARAQEQGKDFWRSERCDLMMFTQYPNSRDLTRRQKNEIIRAINAVENSFAEGDASLIDLGAIIDYYLVNEFMHTIDAGMFCSVYIYRKDGIIGLGPVWDFHISTGNCDYNNASASSTAMQFLNDPWFRYIYRSKDFERQLQNRWKELSPKINKELIPFIDATRARIDASQQANYERWPMQGIYVWPNYVVKKTYEEEFEYLRNWIISRFSYLDLYYK